MNKKDQMTVENFVSTGMELEALYNAITWIIMRVGIINDDPRIPRNISK